MKPGVGGCWCGVGGAFGDGGLYSVYILLFIFTDESHIKITNVRVKWIKIIKIIPYKFDLLCCYAKTQTQ